MLGWLTDLLAGRPRAPRNRKELFKIVKKRGWTIEQTRKGHYKLCPPEIKYPCVVTSGTTSDVRSVRNLMSNLRQSGLDI